jgi:hypothetical protein
MAVFISLMTISSSPPKGFVQLAPECSLTDKGRQVSPQAQLSTFNGKPDSTVCQIRSKDKAPCPLAREMGPSIYFTQGLRVSRLLNRRAVSGSKSDTPTRANNIEGMIYRYPEKIKDFNGIME